MSNANEFTDSTVMPFGKKYKGMKLIEIPDDYFMWFWEENKTKYLDNQLSGNQFEMMRYIDTHFEDLP